MADPRDDRVSRAYREMPGDGPPAELDSAIQAAARRAVGSRPGAIRRLQLPLSIAAVLALAIGVSLQMEREKPMGVDGPPVPSGSAEYPVPQAASEAEVRQVPGKSAAPPGAPVPAAPGAGSVSKEMQPEMGRMEAPPASIRIEPKSSPSGTAPQPVRARDATPVPEAKRFAPDPPRPAQPFLAPPPESAAGSSPAPAAQPASPAAAPPVAAGAARPAEAARSPLQAIPRAKSEAAADSIAREEILADAPENPEQQLERIAQLRAKGQHDEADRALADFRRAFPGHRISDEWLRKVERR